MGLSRDGIALVVLLMMLCGQMITISYRYGDHSWPPLTWWSPLFNPVRFLEAHDNWHTKDGSIRFQTCIWDPKVPMHVIKVGNGTAIREITVPVFPIYICKDKVVNN